MVKVRILGGEADPISVPRGNFNPELSKHPLRSVVFVVLLHGLSSDHNLEWKRIPEHNQEGNYSSYNQGVKQ